MAKRFSNLTCHLFDPISHTRTQALCLQDPSLFSFHQVALFSDVSEKDFFTSNESGDSLFRELTSSYDHITPIKVTTTTIDDLILERNIDAPQLLKIDAQGAELAILKGARKLFSDAPPLFVELEISFYPYNQSAPLAAAITSYLDEIGYKLVCIKPIHDGLHVLNQVDALFVRRHLLIEAQCSGLDVRAM